MKTKIILLAVIITASVHGAQAGNQNTNRYIEPPSVSKLHVIDSAPTKFFFCLPYIWYCF